MNVLVVYHGTQTYTNTVFEHLNSLARFSRHRFFYCHHDGTGDFRVDLQRFDAVVVHYCLRLPYDQISEPLAAAMEAFDGLKALFIQDEYDNTHRSWYWIRRLGFQLVFTVVPELHIRTVYPEAEFPGVRFVSNLTGYVPELLSVPRALPPPSSRTTLIGYRGRPLPLRYGQLGFEKVQIGRMVKDYCSQHGITCDIAWDEESRIYGPAWYEFMAGCRAMLGSESGSNVFNWDGDLDAQITSYRTSHPGSNDDDVYHAVIAPRELHGVMNQVSPRVFEAISSRTVLVLFEGVYSGVVEPGLHYIPLRKDGSNLGDVVDKLRDDAFVDAMAERAWKDVIGSERYGFPQWVKWVDSELTASHSALGSAAALEQSRSAGWHDAPGPVTTHPLRYRLDYNGGTCVPYSGRFRMFLRSAWLLLPRSAQVVLGPLVRGVLRVTRAKR